MNNRTQQHRIYNKNAKDFVRDGGNRIVYFDLINFSYYCSVNRLENLNDFIVQQFTGLFDKNNVPIYEGDILKYEYSQAECYSFAAQESTLRFHDLYVVEYRDAAFRYKELKYGDISEDNLSMVVVGNIFQNQNLI